MKNHLTDSVYGKTNSTAPRLVAVIDIGATSVRMQIAQINTDGTVERLESLSQAMSIGKDSFMQGYINRRTIEECSTVLLSYRKKLEEYGVDPRAIRAVATSGCLLYTSPSPRDS